MSDYINKYKQDFEKSIDFFQKELSALRIGRANPNLVENVAVEAYGAKSTLKELASITVSDAKTLTIQPWDKSIIKAIESALQQADLGTSPIISENVIIINLPSITEENRLNIIKKLHQKEEEAKIAIKGQREKIRERIIIEEKGKIISEDEKYKFLDELDLLTKQYNDKAKVLTDKKESEIRQI